jgi:hypothetical protein
MDIITLQNLKEREEERRGKKELKMRVVRGTIFKWLWEKKCLL